jgi:hypothetical protein
VLRQATREIAQRFEPEPIIYKLEKEIRHSTDDRNSTAGERRLYAQVVRQPSPHGVFKPPSRTDFIPRVRVSAAAG